MSETIFRALTGAKHPHSLLNKSLFSRPTTKTTDRDNYNQEQHKTLHNNTRKLLTRAQST